MSAITPCPSTLFTSTSQKKKHKFTTNMTFLENKMSWMIFHPSKLLTYLLYRFLEPPENQLAETTNIPKKGGMFFFSTHVKFQGSRYWKNKMTTSRVIPNFVSSIPCEFSNRSCKDRQVLNKKNFDSFSASQSKYLVWWHQDIMPWFFEVINFCPTSLHVRPGYPGDNPAAPKASQWCWKLSVLGS